MYDKNKSALVILESLTKAKHIEKIAKSLGWNKVRGTATFGHIRGLANTGEANIGVFNWDQPENLLVEWEINKDKEKLVRDLIKKAQKVDEIYLASDPDREGEAIAWHVATVLSEAGITKPMKRIRMNSITEKAFVEQMNNPTTIDMNMVNAANARAIRDKTVGFLVSPKLWKRHLGASAGSVQSPVLSMIIERYNNFNNFQSTSSWKFKTITGITSQKYDEEPKDKLVKYNKDGLHLQNLDRKETKHQKNGNSLFSTTDANTIIPAIMKTSVENITSIMQGLFEAGYITYIRTDSKRCDPEVEEALDKYIKSDIHQTPVKIEAKAGAQDGHPAITPTSEYIGLTKKPDELNFQQWAVFQIIRQNTILSALPPMKYTTIADTFKEKNDGTEWTVTNSFIDEYNVEEQLAEFEKTNETLYGTKFWTQTAMKENIDINRDEVLKQLDFVEGEFKLDKIDTKPQPPYTQATLLKDAKKKGIGRPSTENMLVSVNNTRGYTKFVNGKLVPTSDGIAVNEFLTANEPWDTINYAKQQEETLDKIEKGTEDWRKACLEIYKQVHE